MSVIVAILIVGVALLACVVAFYVFPSTMASLLRYKLWPLRDELSDAITNGEFQDSTQPNKLLRNIEVTIQVADDLRPLNMVVLMLLARRNLTTPEGFDLSKAPEDDRPRLATLSSRFLSMTLRHVLLGSWSGLLLLALLVPVLTVASILRGRSKGGDGPIAEAAKQVALEPTLAVLARQPVVRHLSASV